MKRLLPLVLLAACADGPTKEESAQIYAAANTAMTSARTRAVAQANGTSSLTAPADLSLDYTGACSLGGTVRVVGTHASGAGAATFDLDVTFDGCQEAQGTIDGGLDWSSGADATGFTATLDGDLDWVGQNSAASCEFDLALAIGTAGIHYTGSLCGYAAAELHIGP